MAALTGAILGVLFGIGLALGGMTEPATVLAFLDFFGDWDPSLAFVMIGAIAVYAPVYHYMLRSSESPEVQRFITSANQKIDAPLVVGAAVFGVGWGLAGFCPGPALVSAGTGSMVSAVFALSMISGMVLFLGYDRLRQRARQPSSASVNR